MEVRGAIAEQDKYSALFLRVTRAAGILVPIVAVMYGVAVMLGIAPASPAYNFVGAVIVLSTFMLLGIVQLIVKPSTPLSLGIFIGLYHVFAILYLMLCPGFISPITFCWIVLVLITEIFYGKLAALLSIVALAGTCAFLYLMEPVGSTLQNINYPLYFVIIIVSSILIMSLRSVQIVEHKDLKRTQVQEQYQRGQMTALINSLNAAIISISSGGTVRIYNAALLNLIDTNQSLSGKNIDDVLHLHDNEGNPVSVNSITHATKKIIERDDLSHRFEDGESIRLSISCAPIRGNFTGDDNQHGGYIFIVRDITREKSLEEERDEFISVVSHELRTPIAIAEGTLSNMQFLINRAEDPKTLLPALQDAHEQVVYLSSMVNDLATLSRAERGTADQAEKVDIQALLEELYHRYQPKAEEKKLRLDINAGHKLGTVTVSRLYLEEILQNFITNAIKYTQEGSVSIEAHREPGGIRFAVRDTGIGISKSDQKHMFEKFYRSEDYRTRETSGTGLGLYVVRKLADKLGIAVKFESQLNHGTTFGFVLPDQPIPNIATVPETLTKQGQ